MDLKLEVELTFSMTSQLQLSHMQQLPISRSEGEAESGLNITSLQELPRPSRLLGQRSIFC